MSRHHQMVSPVRCLHCRTVYDMGAVQTVGRYTDCTVWRCPGCNLQVDDRCLSGWGGRRDIERVPQPHPGMERHARMDMFGHTHVDHVIWPPASGYYPI